MANCIKCGKPATYDSPENLCNECWHGWWFEGYNEDENQEVTKVIEELVNKIIKEEKDKLNA